MHFHHVVCVNFYHVLIFILYLFLMCVFLAKFYADFYFLINYRLQYKGTPKYLGESVTAIGIGIHNFSMVHVRAYRDG